MALTQSLSRGPALRVSPVAQAPRAFRHANMELLSAPFDLNMSMGTLSCKAQRQPRAIKQRTWPASDNLQNDVIRRRCKETTTCRCRRCVTPMFASRIKVGFVETEPSQFQNTRRSRTSGSRRLQVSARSGSGGSGASLGVQVVTSPDPAQEGTITMSAAEVQLLKETARKRRDAEKMVEQLIVNCRFFTLAGVFGSLVGSLLCFLKGTYYVYAAVIGYIMMLLEMPNRCKVVLKLIEALDTYLVGTVMLIFGMGLYELFVMKLNVDGKESTSNFFGMFLLEKRPPWLAIKGLDDLKTKLGHVIVMILLVGMFEKSKIVHPTCSLDLFWTAGSVLLCALSLYLLSRLKPDYKPGTESAGLH